MEICRDIASVRSWRQARQGSVAFVPTMGYLHEGHLELMREAARRADHVIVSIFVNPTQFGPGEDFESYPRDLERDAALCASVGVDAVFSPSDAEMYPPGSLTAVSVERMTDHLCGAHRPGHFDGVTTIVSKLFNIVSPDVAVFGQKDYQQLAVIRRMVRDLNFPIEIVGVPTVREEDGVAMSSRNRYLGEDDRIRARALSAGLTQAWRAWQDGERVASVLLSAVMQQVAKHPELSIDYVEAIDPDSLATLSGQITGGCVIALAVHVGSARLIDNLRLDEPLPKGLSLT